MPNYNALIESAAPVPSQPISTGLARGVELSGGLHKLQALKMQMAELHDKRRWEADKRRIMGAVTDPEERIEMLRALGDFEGANEYQRLYLQEQELGFTREDREQQAGMRENRNAFLEALPPDQQAFGRAFPDEFGERYGSTLFPEQDDVNWQIQRVVIDGKPALVQIHPRTGEVRLVEGMNPLTSGLKLEVGPDGSMRLMQGEGISGDTDVGGRLGTNYRWQDPSNPLAGAEPIPGTSADALSPEQAAKTQLLFDGLRDIQTARGMIIGDDGQVMRGNLVNMAAGTPFTEGRTLYSMLYNAIEAKLRAESGAAVPEPEVERIAKRFIPSALDSDETVISKLDRLEEFMRGTLDVIDPTQRIQTRRNVLTAPTAPPNALSGELILNPDRGPAVDGNVVAPAAGTAPGNSPELRPGTVSDGFRYRGGDPNEPSSWEPVR